MTAVDQDARDQALDISQSICVTAPAGSGKTELLTQRLLKLLAVSETPEQVLAITFTRKAAAEMRERVVDALTLGAQVDAPAEAHKVLTWQLAQAALANSNNHNWELAKNPARIRVQTIDSLCQSITREQPIVSQFGSSPKAVDNAAHLYDAAVDNLLVNLETQSDLSDDLASALLHVDNNVERLKGLLTSLLAKRDQWLNHTVSFTDDELAKQQLTIDLNKWIEEEVHNAAELLFDYESDLCQLIDYAANNLAANDATKSGALANLAGITELPEPAVEALEQWQAIVGFLLTAGGTFRKTVNKKNGFPAPGDAKDKEQKALFTLRKKQCIELIGGVAKTDGLEQALEILAQLPAQAYGTKQWALLGPLTRLLNHGVGHLKLVFAQTGQCDHLEITSAALLSLGDDLAPTTTRLRWDHTLRHILVDEFQDTALMQFGLVRKLTNNWIEENELDPENPRTLFVVGDGMQSIYGFRAAKVGLFLKAKEQGIGDLPLLDVQLEQNFRSTQAVVEWNNTVFDQAFPRYTDISRGAVPFYPAIAAQDNGKNSEVTVTICANDTGRLTEAQTVVKEILYAQEVDANGSIAVLVRGRNHLADIIPALRAADIAWQATDIDPLAKTEVIGDLLSLTKALLNPADKLAWLALLRAPFSGLTLPDLHKLTDHGKYSFASSLLAASDDAISELDLSSDGRQIFQRVIGVLKQSWQLRGRKPLRQWIESAWHDIGGVAVLANSDQYDNAQQYFDLLESLDSDTEGFSLTRLTTKLQSLYAKSVQSTDNPVQIMTIHKSKGLEFDTVILPAIDRSSASDSKTLLFWNEHLYTDGDTGLVLCPLDATGDESPLYKFLAAEQKRAVSLEYTRLLYVAATRAKKRLHLIANGEVSDDGEVKAPSKNSLLAKIWPSVKDQLSIVVSTEQQVTSEKKTPSITTLKRLPVNFTIAATNDSAIVGSADVDALETQEQDEAADSNTAIIIGIVIHEILQAIASSDLALWNDAKIVSLQGAWSMRLINSGIDQAELNDALVATTKAISNSLNDKQGRWLLDSAHSDSVCEWPLTFNSGNILYHYVIDRSFVVDGQRWIIDYKSSQPSKGQSQKEFIKQQVAQYSEQLARYTQACQALDGLPVRTALYFPSIPCLHELPPSLF